MQCEIYHPFQCLADLMTVWEKKGRDLRKKKMVVSWAYASSYSKPISVPQSLVAADAALWLRCRFGAPARVQTDARGHGPWHRAEAKKAGVGFDVVTDMDEAFKDADIVYAKSWGPLVTTTDLDEGKAITDKYSDWITNEKRMKLAKDDAIYMHPLPADRNIEVTDGVIDGLEFCCV